MDHPFFVNTPVTFNYNKSEGRGIVKDVVKYVMELWEEFGMYAYYVEIATSTDKSEVGKVMPFPERSVTILALVD